MTVMGSLILRAVGRDGKSYDLGYKAHIAVDVESDMPLAAVVASANENEKKQASELLDKVAEVFYGFRVVVGDNQYSSRRVRDCIMEHGAEPVVPYMSNQVRGMPVLRVDRYVRVSRLVEERRVYGVGGFGLFEDERFEKRHGSRFALYPCGAACGCGGY